ncbi:MAG: class I SAM-dependent methyltransferase [Gemmatimonadaceae bacterium]
MTVRTAPASLSGSTTVPHLSLVVEVQCPSCGSGDVAALFVKHGHTIYRCGACELGFLARMATTQALEALYSASYFTAGGFEGYPDYVGDEPVHRQQARHYLHDLARVGARAGTLLDIGCAAGFFLDEARRAGWRVGGCDVSDYAARYAREHLALDVVQGHFVDAELPVGSVDVATLWSVIAHVPNPRAVERRLYELVRPGGLVAIETSNYRSTVARLLGSRWHLCSPPSVMYYHTRRSLQTLFASSRWRMIAFRRAVKWISVEHALSRLEHRAGASVVARALGRLRSRVPATLSVPYALGDIVFVAFQRR